MSENIKLYSLSTCSHCKSTKKFLSSCNVTYDFTDVDLLTGDERSEAVKAVKKYNPRCSFPTIVIGNKVVIGFDENKLKEALGL